MFVLLILLLATQPAKGQQVKTGANHKINAEHYNGPHDTSQNSDVNGKPGIEKADAGIEQQKAGNNTDTFNRKKENSSLNIGAKIAEILLAAITLILAGVGIWQAIITRNGLRNQSAASYLQLLESRAQTAVNREHSERSLRAYIAVALDYPEALVNGTVPKCALHSKNNGQTPAHSLTGWIGCVMAPADLLDFPDRPQSTLRQNSVVLHRDNPMNSYYTIDTVPYTPTAEVLAKFHKGEFALFFYGRIDYVDVLNVAHFTRFRYIIHSSDKMNGLTPPDFTTTGNEAT